MTISPRHPGIRVMFLMLISTLLISCGSRENSSQVSEAAGITFKLKWPVAKVVESAIPGVVTVRMSISGSDMTTVTKDFVAAAGSGSIADVPVGTSRTITFQGLNSSSSVIYQGTVLGVTLIAGQTYDCGTVTMTAVGVIPVPAAPSGLSAAAVSANQINLVWVDNSNNEAGFKIERKTGTGGIYAQIGTTTANVTSYSDTGLLVSTTYYYRVRATDTAGDSGYTNESNATTLGTTLRFIDKGNGTIYDQVSNLTWLKNANCFDFQTWDNAIIKSNNLASGQCGLSDGSNAGIWHLSTIDELRTFVSGGYSSPKLITAGFTNVQPDNYWSSSTYPTFTDNARIVQMYNLFESYGTKTNNYYVWPVHSGQ